MKIKCDAMKSKFPQTLYWCLSRCLVDCHSSLRYDMLGLTGLNECNPFLTLDLPNSLPLLALHKSCLAQQTVIGSSPNTLLFVNKLSEYIIYVSLELLVAPLF